MANTSTSLTNAWLKSDNLAWVAFAVVLMVLPLPLAFNSIALVLFALAAVYRFSVRRSFRFPPVLWVPIALYLLMAVSWFYTIDESLTGPALSKEISLLLIPLGFAALPVLGDKIRRSILHVYALSMAVFGLGCLVRALVRWINGATPDVFFYHELVSLEVNAIHVSVFMAVAFFILLTDSKRWFDFAAMTVLAVCIVLLSSKNVSVVFLVLVAIYAWFYSGKRKLWFGLIVVLVIGLAFNGTLRQRIAQEYETLFVANTINQELGSPSAPVYNKSIGQAWNQPSFNANDYFPGTAFRVYQARVFTEIMTRDGVWLQGYGLNASYRKIAERGRELGVYQGDGERYGYHQLNFHNQYLQIWAEIGIVGLLLLLWMLGTSLVKGLRTKDFVHISFTVLMITVFLTESFLWRQRGMTFFIALYCVLNASPHAKRPSL